MYICAIFFFPQNNKKTSEVQKKKNICRVMNHQDTIDFNTIQSVVFGGGGAHGISYIGVLESLYKKYGFDCFSRSRHITHISGVSVGAFVGFFLACGFRSVDGMHVLFDELVRAPFIAPNPLTFFSIWGLDDGAKLQRFMQKRLEQRFGISAMSFIEFKRRTGISFQVHATDLATCTAEYFSDTLTPDADVVQSVYASMAVPPFFAPMKQNGQVLVDGGILENVPRVPQTLKEVSLVLRTISPSGGSIESMSQFISQIVNAAMVARNKQDGESLEGGLDNRTITIDCEDIPAFRFNIEELNQKKLLLRGIEAVQSFGARNRVVPCCRSRSVATQTSPLTAQDDSKSDRNCSADRNPTPITFPDLEYVGTPASPSC